jgi:enterochelin esterase-like enzyme
MRINVIRTWVATVLLATVLGGRFAEAAVDDMVQPETLPQGFVIVVDDTTRMASDARPMYLASNVGGWDPAKPEFRMSARSDGKWQYVFESFTHDGTIQFKFTLGSWDYVETDPDGADIDNRVLPKVRASDFADGSRPVIEMRVPRFRSPGDIANERQATDYRDLTVTGTVRRLQVSGGAGQASGLMRDLLVWLPPGYDDAEHSGKVYPVLYLFDGQNLFDQAPGGPREWGVDETLTDLVARGLVPPMIVVGVPHAGQHRVSEYLPFDIGLGAEPRGREFGVWFMSEVKPRVERAFRVSRDVSATGIGGASLGGVIAIDIALQNPGVFGRLMLESVTTVEQRSEEAAALFKQTDRWPAKVSIGVGGLEAGDGPGAKIGNDRMQAWARLAHARLTDSGSDPKRARLVVVPSARHEEAAWAERLPDALRFLFASSP